jgi:hypothetical protein
VNIDKITKWLTNEATQITYGDLVVTVKIHAGKVVLIEKQKTEREKPQEVQA